jgi:hypothetical protein
VLEWRTTFRSRPNGKTEAKLANSEKLSETKAKKVVRLTTSSHTVEKLFAFARRVTLGISRIGFIVILVR